MAAAPMSASSNLNSVVENPAETQRKKGEMKIGSRRGAETQRKRGDMKILSRRGAETRRKRGKTLRLCVSVGEYLVGRKNGLPFLGFVLLRFLVCCV